MIAVVCFQAGLIFYDSLLPEVSTDENRGRIGGIGVGVGYLGSLLAYAIGTVLMGGRSESAAVEDYAAVFRGIAIGFLVFAVPAFVFVRERPRVAPPLSWRVAPLAFSQLAATARQARRYRGLLPFLVGRMFYADAANTLIVMVVLYATTSLTAEGGRGQGGDPSIVAAIPAGLAWGRVVDRVGPKRTLDVVLVGWMAIFALVAAIPVLSWPTWLIYPAGAAVGVALAGLWASDRPLMARLAPPRYYGQFFGLYSMVGRFGAIVGPAMWVIIVTEALGWGSPPPWCSCCSGWSSRSWSCGGSTIGRAPGDPRTCRAMSIAGHDDLDSRRHRCREEPSASFGPVSAVGSPCRRRRSRSTCASWARDQSGRGATVAHVLWESLGPMRCRVGPSQHEPSSGVGTDY